MSKVKTFNVGQDSYNAAMASAVGQDELLSLLTAPIMDRFVNADNLDGQAKEVFLMAMLMAMPSAIKTKVASILMAKVFVEGTQIPVDINTFSSKMVEYNSLLAKLLEWNLADFFTWLENVRKEDVQPAEQKAS
ncbi:MAG: hypothetical protein CTY32_08575 [Methylotenera sp.]|nr:MAG: hypothetical protein CTY32_08575 [Methylotenera sp.]